MFLIQYYILYSIYLLHSSITTIKLVDDVFDFELATVTIVLVVIVVIVVIVVVVVVNTIFIADEDIEIARNLCSSSDQERSTVKRLNFDTTHYQYHHSASN